MIVKQCKRYLEHIPYALALAFVFIFHAQG